MKNSKRRNNKIRNNALMSIFDKEFNKTNTIDYKGIKITIKNSISLNDIREIIEIVSTSCVDVDMGTYEPALKSFLIDLEIILYYTNIRMPKDLKSQYDIITQTDLFDVILPYINAAQYTEIVNGVDSKIAFLLNSVNNLATAETMKLTKDIEYMTEILKNALDNISNDGIRELTDALNNASNSKKVSVPALAENNFENENIMNEETISTNE